MIHTAFIAAAALLIAPCRVPSFRLAIGLSCLCWAGLTAAAGV